MRHLSSWSTTKANTHCGPHWKEIPRGWNDTGVKGDKQTCKDYVDRTWIDMRELSLRTWMAEQETNPSAAEPSHP